MDSHLYSSLKIIQPPIKVFYKLFEEEDEIKNEKYIVMELNGSADFDKKYKNFVTLLQLLKCDELEEGCFKLALPYDELEPILNQYGYNMIETQIEM